MLVPWERDASLLLDQERSTAYLGRGEGKLQIFTMGLRLSRHGFQQKLRFLKRIFVSIRHGFQERLRFLSKFSLHPSRIIVSPSRISAKILVFKENTSLHPSRIIDRPSRILGKAQVFKQI